MTKHYFEDLGRIAETNAKSAQQSARIASEYWVASRERNNKVAQQIAHTITEGMRRQTEANEELTTKIFEILEERDEARGAQRRKRRHGVGKRRLSHRWL
jgi:hypothetical protein